ncbi:MAG: hypothetical protein NUV46_00710, partial [Nanoarchaeota archaeon]|nr:hypothetical protein [Nanoarchaeota archaeon]
DLTLCITLYYNMGKLIWDELIVDHIKKHNVKVEEVEEAFINKKIESETYLNRKKILGITKKRRRLTIIISQNLCVVTARDMSRKERIKYYEKTKTDETI